MKIKSITLIFDDDTQVTLTGDKDKIAEMIRPGNYKGLILHSYPYQPSPNGWDLDRLKELLEES